MLQSSSVAWNCRCVYDDCIAEVCSECTIIHLPSLLVCVQCESDLAEAIPALEAAIAALKTLKVR